MRKTQLPPISFTLKIDCGDLVRVKDAISTFEDKQPCQIWRMLTGSLWTVGTRWLFLLALIITRLQCSVTALWRRQLVTEVALAKVETITAYDLQWIKM